MDSAAIDLLNSEFDRLATHYPNLWHTTAWTKLDWDATSKGTLLDRMMVNTLFPLQFPLGVCVGMTNIGTYIKNEGHWLDVSGWLGEQRPRLAQGWFSGHPANGYGPDAVGQFWGLARKAEEVFGLESQRQDLRFAPPLGSAWLARTYAEFGDALEEFGSPPGRDEILTSCSNTWEGSFGDPQLKADVEFIAQHWRAVRRLSLGIFPASAALARQLQKPFEPAKVKAASESRPATADGGAGSLKVNECPPNEPYLGIAVSDRTVSRIGGGHADFGRLDKAWRLFKTLYDAGSGGESRAGLMQQLYSNGSGSEEALKQLKRSANGALQAIRVEITSHPTLRTHWVLAAMGS